MMDYDYLNARIKGMSSSLLRREFYNQALAADGGTVLVDSLLDSAYGPALRESLVAAASSAHRVAGSPPHDSTGRDTAAVESALRRNLFETFAKVRSFAPPEPLRLLSIQFRRWDMENVRAIVRGKAMAAQEEDILEALFPVGELDEARLAELVGEPDVAAVADTLAVWDFPLAFELRRITRDQAEAPNLSRLEFALDRGFFSWAVAQLSAEDNNQALLLAHLRLQIDLTNVMTALKVVRQKVMNKEPSSGGGPEPIPFGGIRADVLREIEAGPDIDSALRVLASTHFAQAVDRVILAFGETRRLGLVERCFEAYVIERGCRMFRMDPLSIAVPLGFIWWKYNELLNLRILLRGKLYGKPANAIREELLLVS